MLRINVAGKLGQMILSSAYSALRWDCAQIWENPCGECAWSPRLWFTHASKMNVMAFSLPEPFAPRRKEPYVVHSPCGPLPSRVPATPNNRKRDGGRRLSVCAVLCGGDCHWLNPCPGTMHSQSTLTQLASTRKVGAQKDSCSYAPGTWVQQGLLFLSSASTQSWAKEEVTLQVAVWELEWKALHLWARYRVSIQSLLCAPFVLNICWDHR